MGLIPGSGKPPGGGNGNPFQYSSLGNPTDRGAWWAMVHGVAKSRTRLKRYAQSAFIEHLILEIFFKVKKSCSQILDFRSRILFLCMLFYLFLAALGLGCCIGFFL